MLLCLNWRTPVIPPKWPLGPRSLVPPDSPEAIIQIIEWCLEHPEEAAAIAKRGRRDALCLTWEKNAAQYISLFETLIRRI